MLRELFVLSALLPLAISVRCYSSQQTVPGTGSAMVVVDCPAAQFCFKSYIERSHNGQNSYTETRTCGNVGTCYETGCTGPGDNRQCCCAGDMCNHSPSSSMFLSLAALLLLRLLL